MIHLAIEFSMGFKTLRIAPLFGALALFLALTETVIPHAIATEISVTEELVATLALPESKIDLTETLLLISRHWDPQLDSASLNKTIDRLTESARVQLKSNPSPKQTVEILRKVIHRL